MLLVSLIETYGQGNLMTSTEIAAIQQWSEFLKVTGSGFLVSPGEVVSMANISDYS
jgi:hypothetical protein